MSDPAHPEVPVPADRLDSWKQIASYLGRSERTVRRWEEKEGLPVHRLQHEQRGSVYAYRTELDAWLQSRKGSIEIGDVADPANADPVAGRQRIWPLVAAGLLLLALAGAVLALRAPDRGRPVVSSIAVLPFKNISLKEDDVWFADGMTETLVAELVKIGGLNVISRTSSMQYKNSSKSLKEIGAELGVDAVVEGSALHVGNRVRITAQLIATSTDTHLWGRDFDRDLKDVLELQREVAQAMANEVGATVAPGKSRSVHPEAMAAYLKGLYQFNRGQLGKAAELAREAIRIDSQMAQGHELLGVALMVMADFHYTSYSAIMPEARIALHRALALEPDRPVALSWLGWSYFAMDHDWAQAEMSMRRGFERDPATGNNYAFLLAAQGRAVESIRVIEKAMLHDPANSFLLSDAGHIYHLAHRYEDAIRLYRKALELSPASDYAEGHIIKSLLLAGRSNEAFDAFVSSRIGRSLEKEYREEYRQAGWPAVWSLFVSRSSRHGFVEVWAWVFLNRKDDAISLLEKLEKNRDSLMVTLEDPLYDPIRQDPRFKALLMRVGYPSRRPDEQFVK